VKDQINKNHWRHPPHYNT